MKVLMLTPSYSPIVGGTERVVQNLALKLNEAGIQTDVLTLNMTEKWNPVWKGEIRENGHKIFRVPAFNAFRGFKINPLNFFLGINVVPKLNFVAQLKDYDLLHFHDDIDLSFPLFSSFIKTPKIFQCHTLGFTYKRYKTSPLSRSLLRKAGNSYICVSNFAKRLLTNLGIPESKVFVLPNGVNTQKFMPNETSKTNNALLFVGRPGKVKGLSVLLNALSLPETPVTLKVVGPFNTGCNYIELSPELRSKSKVIHEVEYIGRLNEENIIKCYQKASVFICPSLTEDFGIANIEALSCGTPVVASRVGGISEIVQDHTNGLLVPPNNPKDLADAIKELLANPKLRETYGKNGRKMVEDNFSWNHITQQLIKIYKKTI